MSLIAKNLLWYRSRRKYAETQKAKDSFTWALRYCANRIFAGYND